MDTSKLLNILSDLDNEEIVSSINPVLQNLANNINASQTTEIVSNEKKVQDFFSESRVNSYVPSDLEIFEFLGAEDYFGSTAYEKIKNILNGNTYNIQKTYQDLLDYIQLRETFVKTVNLIRENLEHLNFEAYFPTDNNFQIGLLLPDGYTNKKIPIITKELNKWDKIIKSLKELVGEPVDDTEINYVSNGTLEFFIDNSPSIAAVLAFSIDRIVKVYKNVVEIRQTREKLKELGLPAIEQKNIEKQEKDHLTKELDKVCCNLI